MMYGMLFNSVFIFFVGESCVREYLRLCMSKEWYFDILILCVMLICVQTLNCGFVHEKLILNGNIENLHDFMGLHELFDEY